jgi:hypothetical protein
LLTKALSLKPNSSKAASRAGKRRSIRSTSAPVLPKVLTAHGVIHQCQRQLNAFARRSSPETSGHWRPIPIGLAAAYGLIAPCALDKSRF